MMKTPSCSIPAFNLTTTKKIKDIFLVGRYGFALYNIAFGVIDLKRLFLIQRSGEGDLLMQLIHSALFLLEAKLLPNALH